MLTLLAEKAGDAMQNPMPTPTITQSKPNAFNRSASIYPYQQADNLPDLAQVQVNTALPVRERLRRFIADVGDPYLFRVGDTVVHVRYSTQSATLQERLIHLASQ